jgi:hypothetical protein
MQNTSRATIGTTLVNGQENMTIEGRIPAWLSQRLSLTPILLLTDDHTFNGSQLAVESPRQRVPQDPKIRSPEDPEGPANHEKG